jgi:UDP-N-acetylmuramate dehydrogenase
VPFAERRLEPRAGVPLAPFSTLGVGGPARWLLRATTTEDIAAAHAWSADRGAQLFVLGGGSNLVIADRGIDGLVLQIASRGLEFIRDGDDTLVRVEAGEPWDDVVSAAVSRGLAGVECLSGIPGSAGGTPIQNVGAYGQEVADTLTHVVVFDRQAGATTTLAAADCGFAYRMSRFKREDAGRFVVCGMTFRLRPGVATVTYPDVIAYLERAGITVQDVGAVRNAVLAIRRRKGMVLDPADPDTHSVGSFFMNPVVDAAAHARLAEGSEGPPPGFVMPGGGVKVPAAWLIERAGFARGHARGPVGLSSKHPLAIVNRGGATARDVLELAVLIKRRVADRFGIRLRTEPVFAGFSEDDRDVQFLREA